ncbi:MAG TPA: alpha/beta hydrolase [Acidimicrobiales bacterium]
MSLHYVEAGDGPLILLLHGFPEFWYGWRQQIKPLAAAGFRVVAPDMRGYNLSSRPKGVKAYATDQLVADVSGLIHERGAVRYIEAWSRPGAAAGMINYYRSSVRTSPKKAEAALRPISAPTLIVWGERDRFLGPDLAEPDHDDVPNLDRVERLSEASHWVHHDEAERVTQLLIDFFGPARPA